MEERAPGRTATRRGDSSQRRLRSTGLTKSSDLVGRQRRSADAPVTALCLLDDHDRLVANLLAFDGDHGVGDLFDQLPLFVVSEHAFDHFDVCQGPQTSPSERGERGIRRVGTESIGTAPTAGTGTDTCYLPQVSASAVLETGRVDLSGAGLAFGVGSPRSSVGSSMALSAEAMRINVPNNQAPAARDSMRLVSIAKNWYCRPTTTEGRRPSCFSPTLATYSGRSSCRSLRWRRSRLPSRRTSS